MNIKEVIPQQHKENFAAEQTYSFDQRLFCAINCLANASAALNTIGHENEVEEELNLALIMIEAALNTDLGKRGEEIRDYWSKR